MRFSYIWILLLVLSPFLVFFLFRGVVTQDEGYILSSAEKTIQGLLPYRDFRFVYTPGAVFATALSFIIFGTSVISTRILLLLIHIGSCFLIFRIITLSTKNKFYATLALLLYLAWGPTHINFSWPVMYVVPLALLSSFFILKFLETRSTRYLYLAGAASFSIFFFKQNFGIAFLIAIIPFFLVKSSRNIHYILAYIYGYLWAFILFCIYLLLTGSFPGFISDFKFFTLQWILINKSLTTKFIYPDSFFPMILRTFFYLIPAIISISTFSLLFIRRRFHLLFLPIFVLLFYLFGIRPTTDYIHLVPLLSLTGIPFALYLRYNISTTIRFLLFGVIFLLVLLGFYTALFKGYYRWDDPLIYQNYLTNNPKIGLPISQKLQFEMREIKKTVDKYSEKGDYIYVDSYNQFIYFMSDRSEPTRSTYLALGNNPKKYYEEVVGNLVAKKVKILLLSYRGIESNPIKEFILKHYYFYKTFQDFDLYLLKP